MTSQDYNRYRYKCLGGHNEVYEVLRSDEPVPTLCRYNTSHQLDTNSIVIVEVISKNVVTVKEEDIQTGGHFGTSSVSLTSAPGTTSSMEWVSDIAINVLAIEFSTADIHTHDEVDISIGANFPVGMVRTTIGPLDNTCIFTPFKAYPKGSIVTFTHPNPIYGPRVYTCVKNTTPGVFPINQLGLTNEEFWTHGYPLHVDDSVLSRVSIGYEVVIMDMSNGRTSDLAGIISIDKSQKTIYMKKSPDKILTFPFTVVRQTIHPVRRYIIGAANKYALGAHKIGASHLPKDIPVTIRYTNKASSGPPKTLVGGIEFLY